MATSLQGDFSYTRPRRPLTWRQRLARFLRGERRKGNKTAPISQTPPRLGPIGDSFLASDDRGTASLAGDFSSFRFDDKGSLKDFKLSFDVADTKSFEPVQTKAHTTRERRPPRSQPAISSTKRHSNAPSIDLPIDVEDGGFLDTWLKQAVQTGAEERPGQPETKRIKSLLDIDTPVTTSTETTSNKAPEKRMSIYDSMTASRPTSTIVPHFSTIQPDKARVLEAESVAQPKFRAKETKPASSGSMLAPTSAPTSHPSNIPTDRASIGSSTQASTYNASTQPSSTYNPNRYSLDLSNSEMTTRSISVNSKRLSTGSMYSSQRFPGPTKPQDGETESINSTTSVPSRRFEVKTNSLLTPVSKTSADSVAAVVSQTISRINSNNFVAAAPVTSQPRNTIDINSKKSVTDTIKAIQKPDDRNPSRRSSQPVMRTSYHEAMSSNNSPLVISRTPTPEAQGIPTERQRRSSSRLSDRMSWLKDLEDDRKNVTGRDYMFKKLEGGVAAKLARFESGKEDSATSQTPIGRSRSNSNARSGTAVSSDLYGIERGRLSRQHTSETPESLKPGKVDDVVGEGFKKKLESLTGNLATKVQEKEDSVKDKSASKTVAKEVVPESATRGPAALALARQRVPQDVLDLIVLSGVDQEVAINEYLKNGTLGKTKEWDHDVVMKQIDGGGHQKNDVSKEIVVEPEKAAADVQEDKAVVAAPVVVPEPSQVQIEQEKATSESAKIPEPIVIKKEVPIEQVIPSPIKEDKAAEAKATEDKAAEAKVEEAKQFPPTTITNQQSSHSEKTQEQPTSSTQEKTPAPSKIPVSTKSVQQFNAASLPHFG